MAWEYLWNPDFEMHGTSRHWYAHRYFIYSTKIRPIHVWGLSVLSFCHQTHIFRIPFRYFFAKIQFWKTTRTVIWRPGSVLITWSGLHVTVIEIRIPVFLSKFTTTGSIYFTQRYISQTNEVGYPIPDLRYPNWYCLGTARYGTPGGAARGLNLWRCDPLIRGPSFINAPPH